MKLLILSIALSLPLAQACAEHIRSDGMGGFYTDQGHVRSDGMGGYYHPNGDHQRSDGFGGYYHNNGTE